MPGTGISIVMGKLRWALAPHFTASGMYVSLRSILSHGTRAATKKTY